MKRILILVIFITGCAPMGDLKKGGAMEYLTGLVIGSLRGGSSQTMQIKQVKLYGSISDGTSTNIKLVFNKNISIVDSINQATTSANQAGIFEVLLNPAKYNVNVTTNTFINGDELLGTFQIEIINEITEPNITLKSNNLNLTKFQVEPNEGLNPPIEKFTLNSLKWSQAYVKRKNWTESKQHCENNSWRLPLKIELDNFYRSNYNFSQDIHREWSCGGGVIGVGCCFFPNYWSSEEGGIAVAYSYDFNQCSNPFTYSDGLVSKTSEISFRCVK